jgi:signal transduction histidine kinase
MRCAVIVMVTRGFCALAALLMLGMFASAATAAESGGSPEPELLTNLFQLRHYAEQETMVVHPFRIVADVCDADGVAGVLVLRDASDAEFIRLPLRGRDITPGSSVCLEGSGCGLTPKGFGLAVVPGLVLDNGGIHPLTERSGRVFLHAGRNPIAVQWFNFTGDFGLNVDYEGPGLPRQQIPASVLSRAGVEPATGATNFCAGLDYRCCEGAWESLPDFAKLHSIKAGVATNFDLGVRTRNEHVGLEFSGFIKIPRDGVYTFSVASDDGSRLFVGDPTVKVRVLSNGPAPAAIEGVPTTVAERSNHPWVTLEGDVNFAGVWDDGGELQMRSGNDDMRVEVFESGDSAPTFPLHAKVKVSGVYQDVITGDGSQRSGVLLVSSWNAVRHAPATRSADAIRDEEKTNRLTEETGSAAAQTPVITTAAKIKALSADLANRRLPVRICGVVTATLSTGIVIQDATKGVFVIVAGLNIEGGTLYRGEFCQIDGVTSQGSFSPVIIAQHVTHLGFAPLPEPLRATWEQLMNASLDTQYAEIEGVVTAIRDQDIEVLTEGGEVTLEVPRLRPESLTCYENALVQIRGCVIGPFNRQTHKLEGASLRVGDPTVKILRPAPRDLFDLPRKSVGELLLYDPKAALFRMLKVSGQVIYGRAGEYFLSDGTNGMRVITRASGGFIIGDLVDAVGFRETAGPAAELKEAVMRRTGRASLPEPRKLAPENLLEANCADMLVQLDATLLNQWRDGSECVLELRSEFVPFRARINSPDHLLSLPPPGSLLELTGVYSPQGNRLENGKVAGFELLMDSPTGIRILSRPSWWTLTRVLLLAGILAALLCAVLIWNTELRQKVHERTRQLELEIRNRQRAELEQAAEVERTRIARDLHDELGAGLTGVSLLASTGLGESQGIEKATDRLSVIAEKTRSLVASLDLIVWAIDPRHNSLQSFADYLRSYARELLAASNIVCRFRIPIECEPVALTGAARHSLLLAVKESLNNAARHASATEVELHMIQNEIRLQIVIADNGRGFDWGAIRRGRGLTNLQERLETLHGQCHIESQPGKGTTVKLIVPLGST